MKTHLILLGLRLLCLSQNAAHSEMMSTVGERYTPRAIAETVRQPRVGIGAYLISHAGAIRSFIKRMFC
jgi:hypothetical protein